MHTYDKTSCSNNQGLQRYCIKGADNLGAMDKSKEPNHKTRRTSSQEYSTHHI